MIVANCIGMLVTGINNKIIVNVKNTTKGIQKTLEDAKVISDTNDRMLKWLQDSACWLKVRNTQKTKAEHLTK